MKQHHRILIRAENQPATLEQLLRVVRFRGFEIDKVSMNIEADRSEMDICVEVKSHRSIHLLENQLRKLVPIREVRVSAEPMIQAAMMASQTPRMNASAQAY